jgi:hypothetical protein
MRHRLPIRIESYAGLGVTHDGDLARLLYHALGTLLYGVKTILVSGDVLEVTNFQPLLALGKGKLLVFGEMKFQRGEVIIQCTIGHSEKLSL